MAYCASPPPRNIDSWNRICSSCQIRRRTGNISWTRHRQGRHINRPAHLCDASMIIEIYSPRPGEGTPRRYTKLCLIGRSGAKLQVEIVAAGHCQSTGNCQDSRIATGRVFY
ncbi:MAG: hypothetical protein KCHDKBKB_02019 [Elusimicrobia bacterium]|nr:hypothetical protein [Elusimicrobiota bacterium]